TERWVSLLAGGGLALAGLTRGGLGGLALAAIGGGLLYRGWTGHCTCYEQLGINTAIEHNPSIGVKSKHGRRVIQSVQINRNATDLYDFWRNLENLPRVMSHVISVEPREAGRSHWVARGPASTQWEWDAEVHNDRPGELIAWRSLPGSEVATAGSVRFEDAGDGWGTSLTVEIMYDPPGGKMAANVADRFGFGLEQELAEDLRKFKQFMEAGEIATTESQSTGEGRT
ncbi:MAG: SRPBCC family protein, partial [Planctomycetaceae bacterium]